MQQRSWTRINSLSCKIWFCTLSCHDAHHASFFPPSLFFLTRLFYSTQRTSGMLRNTWEYRIITGIFSRQEVERKVLCNLLRVSTWSSVRWCLMSVFVYSCTWAHSRVWTCVGVCALLLHLLSRRLFFSISLCDRFPTELAPWPASNCVKVKLVGDVFFIPSFPCIVFSFIASISLSSRFSGWPAKHPGSRWILGDECWRSVSC